MNHTKEVIGAILYLGIGLFIHYIFFADPFSWSDPITYIIMALWPFALMFLFIWWILIFICVVVGAILVLVVYEEFNFRKLRRSFTKREKAAANHRMQTRRPIKRYAKSLRRDRSKPRQS